MSGDKGNWVGIGILILCGLSAGTMLAYINRGEIARWNGSGWLGTMISVVGTVFIVALILMQVRGWLSRRGGGGGDFLGNDTRSPRRKWWKRD